MVFADYFVTAKVFRRNFSLLCSNLAIIDRIFCNCKYFSGNEGKDLQLQNFFTVNKKQYTVQANYYFQIMKNVCQQLKTVCDTIVIESKFFQLNIRTTINIKSCCTLIRKKDSFSNPYSSVIIIQDIKNMP